MGEVFAGFVCGYGLAVLSTPFLAFALVRLRTSNELVARLLPEGTNAASVGVLLHGALFLFWTALGILLGLVLLAFEDADAGLGSANIAFSLLVFGFALALLAPPIVVLPSLRRSGLAGLLLVVLVFGWLMPHMAGWSRFDRPEPVREHIELFHG